MSAEPFKRLVRLAARAFYDDIPTRAENQPKSGRSDNRGMAVVVLDALTRRQWVKEDDLAKDLKLHSKQLRRTLRFFEEERLIMRDHRRETAKGAKVYSAAVAATADGQQNGKDGEEKLKLHTHSYCCLDYAQDQVLQWTSASLLPVLEHQPEAFGKIEKTLGHPSTFANAAQTYDVVRYRIHRMKKRLKDELEDRNTIQEYICPDCSRRYSAFDALQLISLNDENFHCENCNAELVAESDKLAAEEKGDGDDNNRRRRREKLKELLEKMEVQLKPLMEQLARVKDLAVPEFGSLLQWEARAIAAGRAISTDANTNDSSKSSQGQGYSGTPMPFLGETKVEVALAGMEVKTEESNEDAAAASLKVLPPWMIRQGMNLTNEQRGEVKHELKPDDGSYFTGPSVDRKPTDEDKGGIQQNIQEEYLKAYYAAILKQQQEAASAAAASEASKRRIGMKAKREEDEEEIEWEEDSKTGVTGKGGEPKSAEKVVDDSNAQGSMLEEDNALKEEDDDDIDWEEG